MGFYVLITTSGNRHCCELTVTFQSRTLLRELLFCPRAASVDVVAAAEVGAVCIYFASGASKSPSSRYLANSALAMEAKPVDKWMSLFPQSRASGSRFSD